MVWSKVVTPVKTGDQCFCNALKSLDSGFHRNDDSWAFSTFDESIKKDGLVKSPPNRHTGEPRIGVRDGRWYPELLNYTGFPRIRSGAGLVKPGMTKEGGMDF